MSTTIVVHVDAELEPLMPRFLEHQQEVLAELRAATAQGNFARLKEIGHSMKGVCGGYGLDRLGELGASVELAAKQQDRETLVLLVRAVADYLDRLDIVFDA
jgi:HPt (histidine-containing phosphotransfer) domain-containing protein